MKYQGKKYQEHEQLSQAVYWFRRQYDEIAFIGNDQVYLDLVNQIARKTGKELNECIVMANNIVTVEITKHKASLAGHTALYHPNFNYK